MQQLFISDLHLEEDRPDIVRAFFHFLDTRAAAATELYILGDFFEAWIGDDDDRPLVADVAQRLNALSESGVRLYLMQGNRDFLMGDNFSHRCGATLLPDPSMVNVAGQPTLLMHGDSLCTDDEKYMAFRQQARSPAWQQQILSQPLEARRTLARQLRMASTEANSNKAEDIMDVSRDEVVSQMIQHQCFRLIHGHTHRPARHALNIQGRDSERLVLGDWDRQGWQIRAEGGDLQLESFPL